MTNNYYWQLPDERIWGCSEGGWVDEANISAGGILSLADDVDQLRERIRLYNGSLGDLATIEDMRPGDDYDLIDGQWVRNRFTKKDFLLLCGVPQLISLEAAVTNGNATAKAVHTLLMASEYIDVTDADTIQMVNLLTAEDAGNVLTAADAARILQGVKYEG